MFLVNLWNAIIGSGLIGIIIWGQLLFLSLTGIILGIYAVVYAIQIRTNKYPLVFKLLICCLGATILTGAAGTVIGYIDSIMGLAMSTGAAKAQMLHFAFEQSRMCFYVSLVSGLLQFILLAISRILFHFKQKKLSNTSFSLSDQIRKIPILIDGVILISIPVVIGVLYSISSIEVIITLKPEQTLPKVFGMNLADMLNICFISGCIGIFLLLLVMIRTITSHYSTKH